MSKKHFIIPVFVPHLGCPHDCVFCNQRRITGLSTNVTKELTEKTIEEHLKTIPSDRNKLEVAFYGGSFTGIDMDLQASLLSVPYKYKKMGKIDEIRLSTRPDYIDDDRLNLLNTYGVDTIELGVQSLYDDVLKASGRGHTVKDVYKACELIKKYNFKLGMQMMIGLPEDTREKAIYTAKKIIEQSPSCVRIYPTLVLKDTFLEKMYNMGKYIPITLEKAVDLSTDLLMLFEYNGINVIRIGLQPTENITLGRDVITGPFHPSFRQLVESNIYRIIFKTYLDKLEEKMKNRILKIKANNKVISNIAGQKSKNINYLKEKYEFKDVKIYSENISKKYLNINLGDFYDTINNDEIIKKYLKENNFIPKN